MLRNRYIDPLWDGRARQRERDFGEGCLLRAIIKEFSLLMVPCENPLITRFPHGLQRKITFSYSLIKPKRSRNIFEADLCQITEVSKVCLLHEQLQEGIIVPRGMGWWWWWGLLSVLW